MTNNTFSHKRCQTCHLMESKAKDSKSNLTSKTNNQTITSPEPHPTKIINSYGLTNKYPEIKDILDKCTKQNDLIIPLKIDSLSNQPTSAPVSAKTRKPDENGPNFDNVSKRSNSCVENTNKTKLAITPDRLSELRRAVEIGIKEHRIFSMKGNWNVIRRELLKRNWLEKFDNHNKKIYKPHEDLTTNLPVKQEWETHNSYMQKCEKTIMSRMLQGVDVNLYYSTRKEQADLAHRVNAYKLLSRFSRSLFSSKEGLALLLTQAYWYTEPGVAAVNFPRCYVLGFPDHFNLFVDDFRMTACIGTLKWFCDKYNSKEIMSVQSLDGTVPFTALQFAIQRCSEYIDAQKHLDIDKDVEPIYDHEWDDFLKHSYTLLHNNGLFIYNKDYLLTSTYAVVKTILKEIEKTWADYNIDGMKNIWIVKPGNKCRGRGIQLVKNLGDVEKLMNTKLKYVVQKYIEKPLIIYNTKFDIRQWFLVTCVQPLTIWMFKEFYLRFSSQVFSLENFHESLHLTNHAVQCKYTNGMERSKELPDNNMWDCHTFKTYLKQIGHMDKYEDVIVAGMRESIVCAMLASQDTMDRRANTFEIYGADFMISDDFRPWLIEINCCPDMSFSTSVTSRMCTKCMEDTVKVIIDRRNDSKADTGLFELVYRQNFPRSPPYLGMNLSVRGRKVFKLKTKTRQEKREERKNEKKLESLLEGQKRNELVRNKFITDAKALKSFPKIVKDLIDELHKSFNNNEDNGIDFVPAIPTTPHASKKKEKDRKSDTVSKKRNSLVNRKTNRFYSSNRNGDIGGNDTKRTRTKKYCTLINDLSMQSKFQRDSWEKETISILKGKNIFTNFSVINNGDSNKNYLTSESYFDLNKLLPQINANKNDDIN